MRIQKKSIFAASGLAVAVTMAIALSLPTSAAGWALIGGSLGLSQRDVRVDNNFTDASANNNNTPHVNFPGATGAVMAIWKGAVEWGSVPWAGNGLGDGSSTNSNLGDGGANFDAKFEGTTTAIGNSHANVHSEISGLHRDADQRRVAHPLPLQLDLGRRPRLGRGQPDRSAGRGVP
jgi:hypothetical protein